jgi:signal transduction histidine kinase
MAAGTQRQLSQPGDDRPARPSGWIFLSAGLLVLALLLAWNGYSDYRSTERELRRLLEDDVAVLTEPLIQSATASLGAYDALQEEIARRLLSAARYVAHLDGESPLTSTQLEAIAAQFDLQRVHLFDREGRRVLSSGTSPPAEPAEGTYEPKNILGPILEGAVPDLVIGFREARFGGGRRFAVAVVRPRGGAIVVTAPAEQLDRYRQQVGLGPALARLAGNPSIVYAVIQDEDGPISATPGVEEVSAISSVPELREAFSENRRTFRFTRSQGREVLEGAVPFELEQGYRALFRVGVDLTFYHDRLRDLAWRDAGMSLALLLGGGILFGLIFTAQNYRFLRSRYARSLSMSDRITQQMVESLLVVDEAGRILRANPRAESELGLRAGDTLPPALTVATKDCRSEAAAPPEEAVYLAWGKRLFLAGCQAFPEEPGGTPARLLLLRDVTRQKALEEKSRQEEHLAALGRLVAAVAHEIRNPLNALSMSVQTLRRRLDPAADERNRNVLAVLDEESRRLNRLVEDLLVYARPVQLHRQPVALPPLMERVRTMFAETADRQEIRLRVELAEASWRLSADEDQLLRVLINLVQNAIDNLDGSGEITLGWAREDQRLRLEVADTGPGFTPEALQRALEPFFTTRPQGTGLGLSLSAEILKAHGWRLDLANRPGGGAVVTVVVPAADLLEADAGTATGPSRALETGPEG